MKSTTYFDQHASGRTQPSPDNETNRLSADVPDLYFFAMKIYITLYLIKLRMSDSELPRNEMRTPPTSW